MTGPEIVAGEIVAELTPEQRNQLAEICPEFRAWEQIKGILADAERDFRSAYERTLRGES